MGLMSIALLALATIAARFQPSPPQTEFEQALKAELTAARARIAELEKERDDWRTVAEGWRAHAHNHYAQYHAAAYQQAMAAQSGFVNQAMQQQIQAAYHDCTCVPGRASLLIGALLG